MTRAERGTKRVCPACGAKFYDLNREPIACPACEAVVRAEKPAAPARAVQVVEPEEATPPAAEPAAAAPEIISLEEAEAAQAGDDASVDEDDVEVVDLGDDDEDIPEPDDDEPFLEEDDEEEADVTSIVRSPLDADEER